MIFSSFFYHHNPTTLFLLPFVWFGRVLVLARIYRCKGFDGLFCVQCIIELAAKGFFIHSILKFIVAIIKFHKENLFVRLKVFENI